MIWELIRLIFSRLLWDAFDIEIENEDAEKIATVGDAVEQIKNAVN